MKTTNKLSPKFTSS